MHEINTFIPKTIAGRKTILKFRVHAEIPKNRSSLFVSELSCESPNNFATTMTTSRAVVLVLVLGTVGIGYWYWYWCTLTESEAYFFQASHPPSAILFPFLCAPIPARHSTVEQVCLHCRITLSNQSNLRDSGFRFK